MQKEINKLLKRINAEKLKNNHKECIELYNIVGGLYSDIGSYDEAIHYHEQALNICKTLGDLLGTAMALRYIGESKASLGDFYQAIDYTKKYLELAQKTKNQVEIQRAWTTLGRVYLMQAQDMKDKSNVIDDIIKDVAQEAEQRFQTALNLAESVCDQVDEKEFAQMKIGLLINIGLVNDICGQHGESVLKFNRAIEMCKKAKLKEDLYRCQVVLAGLFRQRNNVKMADRLSDDALTTAKQIGKKLLICDAYIERGLVRMCQRDFKTAKRTFAQAYLEKSPSEEDHIKAIRLTKLSHLISATYDRLTQDDLSSETRMKLCDKLGDLFVAINFYKLAIEFYRRAFHDAKISSKPRTELARILYSMAETYADDGQFEHAVICYEKEITYRNGNDSEQCQSLIKIAHMHEYLNYDPEKISEAYEKALEKAGKDTKLIYSVLKDYVPLMKKKSFNMSRSRELDNVLLNLKSCSEVLEEIETEGDEEINELEDEIANVDDIITDDEGNDEVQMIGKRKSRGSKKFKSNEVGDTPLHEACIKGDIKRVKSLISQGHEVNPRDNAGWIPLHEACNHGHYDIVEYLVENGADVSNRGLKGMSPLHDAATNGHYEIMRLLLRNGANAIALTDSGETVLSCLRDYKKRNYSDMSNRDLSEYKHMEVDLLNIMDKCGFNLMEENIKNLGNKAGSATGSKGALEEARPRPKNIMNVLAANLVSNPVKDYRNVIGTLKRKRINEEPRENSKKANLPATYHTGSNTSVPTKEWLIDDVSREKRIAQRRSDLQDIVELEDQFSGDDDDELEMRATSSAPIDTHEHIPCNRQPTSKSKVNHRKVILDSGDESEADNNDEDDDVLIIREEHKAVDDIPGTSPSPIEDFLPIPSPSLDCRSLSSLNLSNSKLSLNLFNQPLLVTIEDRKLLIPIKDECVTVKWLKNSIIERYSTLVNAKPNISLAPISDPTCVLFDDDLCQDVIRENVIATIESWQLESIEESYLKNCAKFNLSPLDFIKMELRRIDEMGNKLDLSFTRFPKNHIKPIAIALSRRDFTHVNLTGSTVLFDCQQEMMDTIATWRKLNHLNVKCVGLRRCHIESIFRKMKLPELKSLDVSVNSIAYKCKVEFKSHIESLLQACPNLKRLDMRKNHLQFVKSICEPSSELVNLSRILDLMPTKHSGDLEILGSDQNEYSVYSA